MFRVLFLDERKHIRRFSNLLCVPLNKGYEPDNGNVKYLSKGLKDGYDIINFSLLDVCLNEGGRSVKIQLLNIFQNHHIVAKSSPKGFTRV